MLPEKDKTLDEIKTRLIKALNPKKIYLFGSRGRGDHTEDSDYDILVIIQDSKASRFQRELDARAQLHDIAEPIDIFVYTQDEFDEWKSEMSSVPELVLYEGGSSTLANPKMTKEWIKKARSDLRKAEYFFESKNEDFLDGAIYYCQQAIEKTFKAFLANNNIRFKPIHDLDALAKSVMDEDTTIKVDLRTMDKITKYAVAHRYPDARSPDIEPLDFHFVGGGIRLAKSLIELISDKFKET